MSDVDQLLREFQRDFEAGGTLRPAELLARVEGADRLELEALIDGYLARAPRAGFDAAAFAASPAAALADELGSVLEQEAGTWRMVLPRLRNTAQLRRADVVARLARALGAGDRQAKVEAYYHAMERGTLDPDGVSDRVLDALSQIVGSTREHLREAGARLVPEPPGAGAAFARTARPDPAFDDATGARAAPAPPAQAGDDEVDRLFTGGRDA